MKQAAQNIVNTLVVASQKGPVKSKGEKDKKSTEGQLMDKYGKGDLGDNMSPDVNYTLKRLARGMLSEIHGVKKGFFLANTMVLSKFQSQVNLDKYLKHVIEVTKVSSQMKGSESNIMALARMLLLSSIVESRALLKAGKKQGSSGVSKQVFDNLCKLYAEYDFI
jgi:hypothetical protein